MISLEKLTRMKMRQGMIRQRIKRELRGRLYSIKILLMKRHATNHNLMIKMTPTKKHLIQMKGFQEPSNLKAQQSSSHN
jgi:hypothetical protein